MRITKETLTGLIFVALGLGSLIVGAQYRLGSLTAMGPGYFPILMSSVVTISGVVILARAFLSPNSTQPLGTFHFRPLAIIVVAVLVFGLTIDRFGLVVAIAALVLISRLAMPNKSIPELLAILVVLIAIAYMIFVVGLSIPIKVSPW